MEQYEHLRSLVALIDPKYLLEEPRAISAPSLTSDVNRLSIRIEVATPPDTRGMPLPEWLIQAAQAEEDERLGR